MAARKSTSNPRRDEPKPRQGKSSSLLTGLFIGLVIGLFVAAGLAWYFNNSSPFKAAEEVSPAAAKAEKSAKRDAAPLAETSTPAEPAAAKAAPSSPPTADVAPSANKPRVDYTFYGILPGDKPAKQALPAPTVPKSKDVWWLQVAALKSPADADKLKARLTMLGLQVAMQKVDSGSGPLYRIRTGPYKREDDALGDLDTLAANDFEPRLFKEPNTP